MNFEVKPDPAFPTWEETLTFMVDGVFVEAVANGSFRQIRVVLTKPYVVCGDDYNIGFRPPIFCLQAAMVARRSRLVSRGLTELNDCQRMATTLYRLHKMRLARAEEIAEAQDEYLKTRSEELEKATEDLAAAVGNLGNQTRLLRKQLDDQRITPDRYKSAIGSLRKVLRCKQKVFRELECETKISLHNLMISMVNRACPCGASNYQPLKLNVTGS